MKIFLTAIVFLSLTTFAADSGVKTNPNGKYGSELTLKDAVTVDAAMEQFTKEPKKTFLIEAQVDKVCQKKGCWMTLKSKTSDLRITFKDYGFFVPMTLVGKTVLVEGTLNAKKLTLAQTKHYVEDEGGDPSKVTEAKTDFQMIANGVVVKN